MTEQVLGTLLFGVTALLGIRSCFRLWRIVAFDRETRKSAILVLLASIATIITLAALWFGGLTLRRLLGFEALPSQVVIPIGLLIAGAVLLVPTAIERVVTRIGTRTGEGGQ